MGRRRFLLQLGAAATVLWAQGSRAQQTKKFRIAYLSGGTQASRVPMLAEFRRGLRELGLTEQDDYVFEARFAEGQFARLPGLAKDLLALNPDVILASTTPASLAAKAATSVVPIVFVSVADPLGVGLVPSLARPGGNVTGVTNIGAELAGKRLEILKEIVPDVSRVVVLINPDDPNAPLQMRSAEAAAKNLMIRLGPILPIRSGGDLKGAFEAAVRNRASAALRMIDPLESALRNQTVALAAEHRLPVIYPFREAVRAGGLISYGTSLPDQYRQTAAYVQKILNGTKPADLPVEQPTKFELAVNAVTAKALGLVMPAMLLARADEVVE